MTPMSSAGAIAAIVTAMAAVLAVGGGYVQFVLKRSLLPSVEFDVDFEMHHSGSTQLIGEVSCVIKNLGSSMLIVTNVKCRIRYRLAADSEDYLRHDAVEPYFKHRVPQAPASADKSEEELSRNPSGTKWFFLAEPRTFVQPGVAQRYRKPVAMPATVQLLDVLGSFDYRIEVGRTTNILVWLFARPPKDIDWRKGIRNHTARRTFCVGQRKGPEIMLGPPR